jgi:glutamate synthase (NADPH/NADH) large chain
LKVVRIDLTYGESSNLASALDRIVREAVEAVRDGATVLLLDDSRAYQEYELFVDAHLALATVDQALNRSIDLSVAGCAVTVEVKVTPVEMRRAPAFEESLRRRCSLVLHSGQLRNLHDICFALGAGADAVSPYAMYEVAAARCNRLRVGA